MAAREFRVELEAVTTHVVTIEACCAEEAAERAREHAYDDVIEVDRSGWAVSTVQPA